MGPAPQWKVPVYSVEGIENEGVVSLRERIDRPRDRERYVTRRLGDRDIPECRALRARRRACDGVNAVELKDERRRGARVEGQSQVDPEDHVLPRAAGRVGFGKREGDSLPVFEVKNERRSGVDEAGGEAGRVVEDGLHVARVRAVEDGPTRTHSPAHTSTGKPVDVWVWLGLGMVGVDEGLGVPDDDAVCVHVALTVRRRKPLKAEPASHDAPKSVLTKLAVSVALLTGPTSLLALTECQFNAAPDESTSA